MSPEELESRAGKPSTQKCIAEGECFIEDGIISLENERAVTRTLLTHMNALIAQYETTIEQDSSELTSNAGLSRNMRAILELRRREKALYFHGIRVLKQRWLSLVDDG